VVLATPTASPPPWFTFAHPEALPVTADGVRLVHGSRDTYNPAAPAYREAARRIAGALAERYGRHPALTMWHVHNEYGGPMAACYCERSAQAFRVWLRARYDTLDALNEAWGTAFWGQRYGDWAEIDPPRLAPTAVNPALRLDYMRFSSDALLDCYKAERDILHRLSPGVPVTTNFMVSNCKEMDYWRWAAEMDVISCNLDLRAEQADNHIDLAMAADLSRSMAGGGSWLLMEHSTGAVNWQPRNIAKRPGEMRRNSITHVARGADSVLFFQWRAALRGAEKFHSTMLPHAGTDTRMWRDVVALGADLAALAPLRGTRVATDVAVLWDWQSWWAQELEWRPSVDLSYRDRVDTFYAQLWRDHLTADFVHPETDLSAYPLVVVPSLYLTTTAAAENLRSYVGSGGTVVVSYFSGIVDVDDAIHPGGHPGALRDLLGLRVEEWLPLRSGESVRLSSGGHADVWAEELSLHGAVSMLDYVDGPAAGGPAVTRHELGAGAAWYVSTRLAAADLADVLRRAYADAGVAVPDAVPDGVEVVRRVADDGSYLVIVNHGTDPAVLPVTGLELLTGTDCAGTLEVPAGEVRVVHQP
jgi:beta-galactosidase